MRKGYEKSGLRHAERYPQSENNPTAQGNAQYYALLPKDTTSHQMNRVQRRISEPLEIIAPFRFFIVTTSLVTENESHKIAYHKQTLWKPKIQTIIHTLQLEQPRNCFPQFLIVLATLNTATSLQQQIGVPPTPLYEIVGEETLFCCDVHEEHAQPSLRYLESDLII